jgi:hypothetical protein
MLKPDAAALELIRLDSVCVRARVFCILMGAGVRSRVRD